MFQHAADSRGVHPVTESFAMEFFILCRHRDQPPGYDPGATWERAQLEVREHYRAVARRFMAGDLSVAPWMQ